ncbi:hypothetical protein F0562_015582 [Nyssa sinensis]|uniref:Uncharacterized protein n=1 Tax=Nyssa sinensis TaxID=561372 RepID=A0A5J4ZKM4_9ASTE|nr:hypothetical protein F0562_015582 [Nyssa sinensis]
MIEEMNQRRWSWLRSLRCDDSLAMVCNKVLCNEDGCSRATMVDDGVAAAETVEQMWDLVWGCCEGLANAMVKSTDHDGELMMKVIDQDGS